MKLILVAPEPELCEEWRKAFDNLPDVEIVNGYFESLPVYDCMVSPANSFGLMDGGIDASITRYFGDQLMRRVQKRILEDYLGEQPVGTSIIVETGYPVHPYLAHTPTMRTPMVIAHTENVYLALWAMLLAVRRHNLAHAEDIKIVACPGLGTGTGRVPYQEAAYQMSLAYRHFLNPPLYISWHLADERQLAVRYGGDMGFNVPLRGG